MKKQNNYFLGLDIGTDSVGFAAVADDYSLLRLHQKEAWGTTVFDEASLSEERRMFRTSRRRLDRKQQRVLFTQELFAKEIAKTDPDFFVRLKGRQMFGTESDGRIGLFCDPSFSDADYYCKYPTIHHLICELQKSTKPHDVRLVYLACAWLVSHRGHFLSSVNMNHLSEIKDFSSVYTSFLRFFTESDKGYDIPWQIDNISDLGDTLKSKMTITAKNKALTALLSKNGKISKETTEAFPFNRIGMIKLLAGGKVALKDLFNNESYAEADPKSISLNMDDEVFSGLEDTLQDDFALIVELRKLYDWSVLNDILGECQTISEAKMHIYEQHKEDLAFLKQFIKKHCPERYNEIFRKIEKNNYTSYVCHSDETSPAGLKKATKENFSKYILGIVNSLCPDASEQKAYDDMLLRLQLGSFMPKQKSTDNRVIPYQLYLFELKAILQNAESYLPFLKEADKESRTVSEKIVSVFSFRVPYYVGPLNTYYSPAMKESRRPWMVRRAEGKIYPWNFDDLVDRDASEEAFIRRMTNQCTYIPGAPVLPKDSLLYHQFMVLNEINNLRINGERISVALKQKIYNNVFLQKKKTTRKRITDYLLQNNYIEKGMESCISGIDETIKSDLTPQIAFRQLLGSRILSEDDAERIIERSSFSDDKSRLMKWLSREYPHLSEEDKRYLCSLKSSGFGNLSRCFLTELQGADRETGEAYTIISALWNTQNNLMELLSDRFTFKEEIARICEEYYAAHSRNLEDRLDEMRLSGAVRRSVYRTLAITKDVEKAFGAPEKIFIETTRGSKPEQKNQRTKTRRDQILDLYTACKDEDVRLLKQQLNDLGDTANNRLQGDKLFLYFMQMGKCLYTGAPIDIERLGSGDYNIEHIYPQSVVKDDSIINNEILVDSIANGEKSDTFPVSAEIQSKMKPFWQYLRDKGLLGEEKYRRLTRTKPFDAQEKMDFINRQLTETSQAAIAVAAILQNKYPNAKIVYCKAGMVSEFRQAFGIWKSRAFNDLHHAVDAYLNVVTGNVYSMRFSRAWFDPNKQYSVRTETLFTHPVICGKTTVWDGRDMLKKVIATAGKQTAHFTKFAFFKKGGFFDQNPVPAAPGLVPLKKGLPTELFGGYNKASVAFFLPVQYTAGKKTDLLITSVELLHSQKVLADPAFAMTYLKQRVETLLGKEIEEISLPLGMRPWKVNTMLSLDGFRVCIAGSSGGGRCLIAQPVMQFTEKGNWIYYLKKVEEFVKKIDRNESYLYDEDYDHVSAEKNLALYDIYIEKLKSTVYAKRVNNPLETLVKGRDRFLMLYIKDK